MIWIVLLIAAFILAIGDSRAEQRHKELLGALHRHPADNDDGPGFY